MDDVSFWGALTKVEIVAQETFFNQIFVLLSISFLFRQACG